MAYISNNQNKFSSNGKSTERWKGVWNGESVEFDRVFRGHRFTDDECKRLCNGEEISVKVSRDGISGYDVVGSLEENIYHGMVRDFRTISFKPRQKVFGTDFSRVNVSMGSDADRSDKSDVSKLISDAVFSFVDGFSDEVDSETIAMVAAPVLPELKRVAKVKDVIGDRGIMEKDVVLNNDEVPVFIPKLVMFDDFEESEDVVLDSVDNVAQEESVGEVVDNVDGSDSVDVVDNVADMSADESFASSEDVDSVDNVVDDDDMVDVDDENRIDDMASVENEEVVESDAPVVDSIVKPVIYEADIDALLESVADEIRGVNVGSNDDHVEIAVEEPVGNVAVDSSPMSQSGYYDESGEWVDRFDNDDSELYDEWNENDVDDPDVDDEDNVNEFDSMGVVTFSDVDDMLNTNVSNDDNADLDAFDDIVLDDVFSDDAVSDDNVDYDAITEAWTIDMNDDVDGDTN